MAVSVLHHLGCGTEKVKALSYMVSWKLVLCESLSDSDEGLQVTLVEHALR